MTCPQARRLGAVALGADDHESDDVERHLRTCVACRTELAELRDVSALLSLVQIGDLTASASPPPNPTLQGEDLLSRVLATMTAERETRTRARRRRVLVAVAAVFLAAAGGVGIAFATTDPPRDLPLASSASGVRATTTVRDKPWGTRIEMALRGLPGGSSCRLVAVARDGSTETVATWHVTYEDSFQVEGMTSIRTGDLAGLQVIDRSGRRLIDVAVTPKAGPAR